MIKSLRMKRKAKLLREGTIALREGALRSNDKKRVEKKEAEIKNSPQKEANLKKADKKEIFIEPSPIAENNKKNQELKLESSKAPEKIQELKLELPKTLEKIGELKLELPKTPEKISELKLELPKTPEKIGELKLELPKTPEKIQELKLELPKTPEKIQELKLELPKAPEKIAEIKLEKNAIIKTIKSERSEPAKPKNIITIAKPEAKKAILKDKKPRLVAESKVLQALNLGKSYGGKPAVRDVSIKIHRGEAVGLLGPNGAGKTTSFYMIMGLIKPDYGTISLDGNDITNLPVYRRARLGVGYLPQEASIFRGLSVEENILAVLELIEPAPEVRQSRLEELLAEFSISHLRRTPAVALSGGERRRVEIARALASNPSFILLDEPLAGIDPVAVNDIKELISHLKHHGIGVLITDHNVREALDLLDRAYIIHNGTVLMEGTPKEIVDNKEVRRVYLGEKFVL